MEAVAMGMWDPDIASVRERVAGADGKILFDKFHIARHLGEAVNRVRRREYKMLRAAGDDRLTGTRDDWLRHPAAMALYGYVYERPARKHFRWWHGGGGGAGYSR